MPRRNVVTQATIARVVKGAQAGGLTIDRVEVEGDKLTIYARGEERREPASELDAWRAKRDARSA